MSERDRKRAYALVAEEIDRAWPRISDAHLMSSDRGVLTEVLRIREELRAASEVPLSPEVPNAQPEPLADENDSAAPSLGARASPEDRPEVSEGAPRSGEGAGAGGGQVEQPPPASVSCDEAIGWLNAGRTGAEGEHLLAIQDHFFECGSCWGIATARAEEAAS